MYAYRGKDSGLLRTKWYKRKTEATKEANKFIAEWIKIDMNRDDAKFWVDVWREEGLELIEDIHQ